MSLTAPDSAPIDVTKASSPGAVSANAQHPWSALTVTTVAQLMVSVALTTPSVLAPVVAPQFGFRPQSIGVFVSAMYLAAIISGIIGGQYIRQYGAVRFSQWALIGAATGLGLVALNQPWILVVATLAIGTGYGLTNPAAAHLLSQHAPIRNRGLFFSIKQTGVPIGVALAGLIVPLFLAQWDWQAALAATSAMILTALILLQYFRSQFDKPSTLASSNPAASRHGQLSQTTLASHWSSLFTRPLKRVLSDPGLRPLAISSFCFASVQVCFLTFVVSDLKVERAYSLAGAAGVLAIAQVTSIAARPFWGVIADRFIAPIKLLGMLGIAMAGTLLLFALLPASAPVWLTVLAVMLASGTVVGWNGVFYAGLIQFAHPQEVAMITGGTQFLTFTGAMMGPLLFASSVTVLGSYWSSFLLIALIPLIMGVALLRIANEDAAE